jgi:hypothetical protein
VILSENLAAPVEPVRLLAAAVGATVRHTTVRTAIGSY